MILFCIIAEISRTVVKPDPSSPLNPQVSRSAQAPTSGNVTTPILNTTVSTGGGSTTFPTKLSTQQIATTTLFTRRTTTGPQGTDIPIDSPCRPFYSKTNLPQDSIDMAHFQMHPFYPLVYTYCSVNLLLLICSVHLPVFDIVSSKILPPCSDLCDQVSMDCSYAIRKLKFPISTLLQQCSSKSTPGNTTNTKCFLPKATPERKGPNVSCCFDVKPQPFCNTSTFVQSSLNRSQQDEVIFNLSTMYLPIFHALESLNQPVCAARLSDYLCLKKFQYCVPGSKNGGCSGEIYKPFRENCLFFADNSSPCSIHHINTILQKAGYNIQIMTTDFDCSTLQSITSEAEELSQNILRFTNDRRITNGLRIPRLTNVVKPRGSERTVHWDSLRDTKEIKEYGILWRKREGPDSSKNNYQHNHTTKEYYKFNGIPTLNSQYEVLLTAIGQDGIPQPFTTVELPLTNDYCPSEEVGSLEAYGIFQWPETAIGIRATIACPYNNDSIASRDCLSTNQTESGGVWGPSLVTDCKYMEQRSGNLFLLSQREVNSSNVVNITKEVKEWSSTNQNNTLNPGDIDYIATILNSIALVKEKANEVLDDFLTIIDNVLDAQLKNIVESQQNRNSSSRIVETLNTFAESLVIGPESELQAVKKNFDISLQTVKPQNFSGLNFSGIISKTNQSQTRNNTSKIQSNEVTQVLSPSLIIPRTIFNESTEKNRSANQTVIFVLYRETKFFILSLADTTRRSSRLNSLVISGSIEGLSVSNLSVPVNIALPSIERGETKSILCSYWDFSIGNWSQDGCKFERVLEDGRVLCSCDHFTNFAMLMDIAPGEKTAHDKILGVISYIGCALSLAGLILTIFTILILRDLRTQIPSQILLNFCIALSVTLIVFIAAVEKTRTSSLAGCRAAAIALHYFLLAALFWMAVEAYNMYWAFVKVFSAPSRAKLLIKCCVFAWGTPAVVVGITMVVALDKYGDGT
ncbi:uncharacterized protein LOC114544912, partial [Dendronephthya gigantea]|uniref:uncharacterized protein LOC114544912 n=1 Tax=Dendronephthya gigantea TaxID=151771 RepID=UPI001069C495